jgi:hypothetical protein
MKFQYRPIRGRSRCLIHDRACEHCLVCAGMKQLIRDYRRDVRRLTRKMFREQMV